MYAIIYNFITGPLLWLSFLIFFIGLTAKMVLYIRGLDWKADRIAYTSNVPKALEGATKSILHWITPFASRNWRDNPTFTVTMFAFHITLLFTPIFLLAHNIILKQRWGFSFPIISETTADLMTIVFMVSALLLLLRRIAYSEVRILTTAYDLVLMFITAAPFVTGFICSRQLLSNYDFWVIAHILTGEIMLIAIPFTKLSHTALFFLSRAQLGIDFGLKRGGLKGRGISW